MASVSVLRRNTETDKAEGRPPTWRVIWREPSGRQRSKTFKRKTDADAYAISLEHSLRESTYLDPTAATMTVGRFATEWRKGQVQLSPTSAARYDGVIRNQINPRWEHVSLGKVTHEDVQTWIAELGEKGQAARSVVKAHMLFSRILDAAVRARRIPANPARGAVLPRAQQKAKVFLDHDQVADLVEACEEESEGLGLIVLTLAYTGLRFGELAALRVRDFDSAQRRLSIERSVTDVDGVMTFGPTKTHSHREVPVTASLAKKIAAHLKATGRTGDDLLFTSPGGQTLRNNNFRRRGFDAGAAAAGLEGFVPHDLRHTAASLAVAAGADVKAVQRMLGHASAAMTLDVYSQLFEKGLDDVAKRMDRAAAKAAKDRAKRQAVA